MAPENKKPVASDELKDEQLQEAAGGMRTGFCSACGRPIAGKYVTKGMCESCLNIPQREVN